MLLLELFNGVLPYKFDDDTSASFMVRGKEYRIQFWSENGSNYQVEFGRYDNQGFGHWGVDGSSGELSTTASVLSTVMACINEFIQNSNAQSIQFSADLEQPSRVKLYDRMVKRLVPPGWNVRIVNDYMDRVYTITKVQAPQQQQNQEQDDVPF